MAKLELEKLKTNEWKATHQDLNYLADSFEIHLETLENGAHTVRSQGQNDFGRPKIIVNNINNFHWTTRVQIAYLAGENASEYSDKYYKRLELSKEEIKNLLLSYTNGFKAFFGRTHMEKAREIIASCDEAESTVAQIMGNFREYMYALQYNPDSSFLKRFEYLDARDRNFTRDLFNKRDIERIFSNYAYTGYNRHHLQEAERIIRDCRNPRKNSNEIYQSIQTYVSVTDFNHNSAFMQCWQKIKKIHRYAEEQNQLQQFVLR